MPMERKIINPWRWQDEIGYVQANQISGHRLVLMCAGQTSTDAEGKPMHAGDMRAQITLALENLETVLQHAGLDLSHVMRLNYYTTDVDRFRDAYDVVKNRLAAAECRPVANLIGVARLALPEYLVEIEATAVA
jgi:enamine deaminase RidA (YjgF/YER057c/UK114 family)